MLTVEAEVHQETLRKLSPRRMQLEPAQMLITQGRFSMNVENIDINVEVLSPKEKQTLTSKLAKDIVHQFMAQPHVVHPVQPRQQPPSCTSSLIQATAPSCTSSSIKATAPSCTSSSTHPTTSTGPTKTTMGKCIACTGCYTSSLTSPYTATATILRCRHQTSC